MTDRGDIGRTGCSAGARCPPGYHWRLQPGSLLRAWRHRLAHDLGACAKNARIGIIDTSADLRHPALKGRNIELGDFLPNGATPIADMAPES